MDDDRTTAPSCRVARTECGGDGDGRRRVIYGSDRLVMTYLLVWCRCTIKTGISGVAIVDEEAFMKAWEASRATDLAELAQAACCLGAVQKRRGMLNSVL